MKIKAILVAFALSAFSAQATERVAVAPADGVTPATPALQKAVDEVSTSGGGIVVVPPGAYVTASLHLKDNVTLRLSKGATLLGSTNAADYVRGCFAVVGAVGARKVAIEGEGTIDGRGWAAPVRDGAPNRWKDAFFFRCQDVRVEGVTMKAPASWTFYLKECEDCLVRGITIYSHANFNNDGIDIDSKNVLIENCVIDSDDDAICPKSDNPDFICENVEVRDCTLASNCNFIKFGTASRGGFRNCFVHDCVLRPCAESHLRYWHSRSGWDKRAKGLPGVTDPITGISGVALEMVDGGLLENIHVSDIKLTGGVQTPIFVRLGRRNKKPDAPSVLRNCVIENISGTSASFIASSITGVPGLRPHGLVLRNIDLTLKAGGTAADAAKPVKENERGYPENRMFGTMLPAYGFYLRHADGIRFENVRTRFAGGREERPAVVMDDCSAVTFDSACSFAKPDGALPAIDTRNPAPAPIELTTAAGRILVDGQDGAILGAWPKGQARSVWHSGDYGLWRLTFKDGTTLAAADFRTNGCPARVARTEAGTVSCIFSHPSADVTVIFVPSETGVDIQGAVTAKTDNPAMAFDLPARLRFTPQDVDRLYFPHRGNAGLGFALKRGFFEPAPANAPMRWENVRAPRNGYAHVFHGNVAMRPLDDAPVPVKVTDFGRTFLPSETVRWIETCSTEHRVNRASQKGQFDVALVDSPHGPFVSGSRLGGTGMLWRFGTTERAAPAQADDRLRLAGGVLAGALKDRKRPRVGFLRLRHGPPSSSFTGASVEEYRQMAEKAAVKAGCAFAELADTRALRDALARADFQAILSPYGEAFPADAPEDFIPMLDRLVDYVRAGGQWIETGGASFFRAHLPYRFCSYAQPYPNLFMDFCELKGADGSLCALFGVRPRPPHEPWKNSREFEFVPGTLGCGGDLRGGYVDHAFQVWAAKGQTLRLPAVRLAFGLELQQAVDAYAAANDLMRPLADKIAPAALDKLKKSVLFKVTGAPATNIISILDSLPVPTLVHVAHYLKGGFDKEYPDHLPSNPARFGSDADHRALIDALHARGHLYSPYTNPTWWCDHPRGPTFLAHGEAPLAVGPDGKPYHEQYAANDGWGITYWHPAVQAANRKTVRQFTQDLPVDLLFQDQCGARRCRYDFNPAAPSPTACTEGLLSMNEEDSRIVPIATEDGWDKVANEQTALCGVSWNTVPLDLVPKKRTRPLAKTQIPPHLWDLEPLAARLMHTKTLFWMHDLGAFVNNQRIFAWMLATGYNMSFSCPAPHYAANARTRGWMNWLACVQRTVCSRIAGAPLVAWRHDRAPLLARADFNPERGEDDGIVVAQWGDVRCAVNLGDVPRAVDGHRLAPYGFHVTAPGLVAAALEGEVPYVKEGDAIWRFSDFVDVAQFPWTTIRTYW